MAQWLPLGAESRPRTAAPLARRRPGAASRGPCCQCGGHLSARLFHPHAWWDEALAWIDLRGRGRGEVEARVERPGLLRREGLGRLDLHQAHQVARQVGVTEDGVGTDLLGQIRLELLVSLGRAELAHQYVPRLLCRLACCCAHQLGTLRGGRVERQARLLHARLHLVESLRLCAWTARMGDLWPGVTAAPQPPAGARAAQRLVPGA